MYTSASGAEDSRLSVSLVLAGWLGLFDILRAELRVRMGRHLRHPWLQVGKWCTSVSYDAEEVGKVEGRVACFR